MPTAFDKRFDNLLEPGDTDSLFSPIPPATSKQNQAPVDLKEKQLNDLALQMDSLKDDKGNVRAGRKAEFSKLQNQFNNISKAMGRDIEEAKSVTPSEVDPSGMKSELVSRFSTTTAKETSGSEAPKEESAFKPKPLPLYVPPETPEEAQRNPVAKDPGGPGTYAYEQGFKADRDKIDADLQGDLAELSRKRGIIAVIQGLGMAAAGWYGLHNNVDMSKINFTQAPKFEAEEQAILDKAKFRREQLVRERGETIRQGERAEDLATREADRADRARDREIQRRDTQAFRAYQAKVDKIKEENDNAYRQEQARIRGKEVDQKKLEMAAKLAEKKASDAKGVSESESKAKLAAWGPFNNIQNLIANGKEDEITPTFKEYAINNVLDTIQKTNPELAGKVEALRKEIIIPEQPTTFFFFGGEDRQVNIEQLPQLIEERLNAPVYYSARAKEWYGQELSPLTRQIQKEKLNSQIETKKEELTSTLGNPGDPVRSQYDSALEAMISSNLAKIKNKVPNVTREQVIDALRKKAALSQ